MLLVPGQGQCSPPAWHRGSLLESEPTREPHPLHQVWTPFTTLCGLGQTGVGEGVGSEAWLFQLLWLSSCRSESEDPPQKK